MSLASPASARVHWTQVCIDFVRSIGIPVASVADDPQGFLPHVRVDAGGLLVSTEQVFPGDVLHEAAHLAVIPGRFRALAKDSFVAVGKAMAQYLRGNPAGLCGYPEDPVARACAQCGEGETLAWQYAAATHLGLPDKWLFPKGAFNGERKELLAQLRCSTYLGINGLQAAGWTQVRFHPERPLPVYPQLAFWLFP